MGMEDFLSSRDERMDSRLLFTAQIDKMTAVLRRTLLIDKSRRENDAEHSWHIAVMAMLFREYAAEPVDMGREFPRRIRPFVIWMSDRIEAS